MYVAVLTVSLLKFLQSVGIFVVDGRHKLLELSNTLYKVFAILSTFLEDARLLKFRSCS